MPHMHTNKTDAYDIYQPFFLRQAPVSLVVGDTIRQQRRYARNLNTWRQSCQTYLQHNAKPTLSARQLTHKRQLVFRTSNTTDNPWSGVFLGGVFGPWPRFGFGNKFSKNVLGHYRPSMAN